MKNLRGIRKKRNISMKELGDILGVSESTISLYETGKRQPDHGMLTQIAGYFNTTTDYLLGRTDDPTPPTATTEITDEYIDQNVKFALFGDKEITDEVYDEVKRFARYVLEQEKERKKKDRD